MSSKCDLETYASVLEAVKRTGPIKASNFFLDSNETRELLERSNCKIILGGEKAFFLLKPWHNESYDVFYVCRDPQALASALESLPKDTGLRVSVIGKEPSNGEVAGIFANSGFQLRKKLLRMRCKPAKKNLKDALRIFAEPYTENFGFALPEDAEEILDILSRDFDPVGDNLPMLDEIREAAANKWIPIIRLDNQIASFHYFTLRANILNGLYDVTREEYRGGAGLFPALKYFVDQYLPKVHPDIKRAYGWRDATNKKLVKNAQTLNQNYDGVVIYNMFREAAA